MRLKHILLGAALAGVTLVAPSNLVQAQVCPRSEIVPPAKQTRIIRQNQLNYSFRIPLNYKAMAVRNNGILIYDPNTFATAQCLVRNRVPTEFPYYGMAVYARPVNPGNRSVADVVRQNDPTIEDIENTTVANRSAVTYPSSVLGYHTNVSFFSPDRKYMITLSSPFQLENGRPTVLFNKQVFDTLVSSFTFNRR